MTSLDCAFINSKVPIVYMRVTWAIILPFVFSLIILLVYLLLVFIKVIKSHKNLYIISGFVFILLYCQPGLLAALIMTISCKKLREDYYINSDVSYKCYDQTHLLYMFLLIIPVALLWGIYLSYYLIKKL
jgi:hypothetical protein